MEHGLLSHEFRIFCSEEEQHQFWLKNNISAVGTLDSVSCFLHQKVIAYALLSIGCINLTVAMVYYWVAGKESAFLSAHQFVRVRSFGRAKSKGYKNMRGISLLVRGVWMLAFSYAHINGFPFNPRHSKEVHPNEHMVLLVSYVVFGCCMYIIQGYLTMQSVQRIHGIIHGEKAALPGVYLHVGARGFRISIVDLLILYAIPYVVSCFIVSVTKDCDLTSDFCWQEIYLGIFRVSQISGAIVGLLIINIFRARYQINIGVEQVLSTQREMAKNQATTANKQEQKKERKKRQSRKKFKQLFISEVLFAAFGILFFVGCFLTSFYSLRAASVMTNLLHFILAIAQYTFSYLDTWKTWQKHLKLEHRIQRKRDKSGGITCKTNRKLNSSGISSDGSDYSDKSSNPRPVNSLFHSTVSPFDPEEPETTSVIIARSSQNDEVSSRGAWSSQYSGALHKEN